MITTPTTQELADNIVAQVESSIAQTLPLLPKGFTRVVAKALAAVFVLGYKYVGFMFLQLFVAYASMQETTVNGRTIRPLVEWGRLIGVGDPLAATRGEHTIQINVTNQVGSLPAGSQLINPTTQVVYTTLASVALSAATVNVDVRAATAGTIGNVPNGTKLQFANPLPNIVREATVTAQTVTAADAEETEAYRARIIRRFQAKPQGGAYADYQVWAESVPGIVAAYPYTSATPSQVDVYAESAVVPGNPDGIPTTGQLNAVKAAIEFDANGLASNRPAGALVNVFPIVRTGFDLNVYGLAAPDMAAAESAIEDSVDEYLRSRAPFIVGLSVLPRQDRVAMSAVGGVVDDAVSAVGGTFLRISLELGGVETPVYTLADGEKAKLGTTTYV